MKRLLLAMLMGLVGCQSVVGPFAPRNPVRVDDPHLTIPQQEELGRERLALPEQSLTVAPRTLADQPTTGYWR
jgi:hypothetical protein